MLSQCKFALELRKSQREILDVIFNSGADKQKLYIVSPPGSGKTITGLFATVKTCEPTLVFVPNTAIQSQWIDKTRFFIPEKKDFKIASIDPYDDHPITVLTYQMLARPSGISGEEELKALEAWKQELIEEGEEPEEAAQWLKELETNNPERFDAVIMQRTRKTRLNSEIKTEQLETLVDPDVLMMIERFRNIGVKLIIFDECHHLLGYWAQVALLLVKKLENPRVIGLTATPPIATDLSRQEYDLHRELLADIDFHLPTPAVVKDGHLVPYQDLAFFVRPLPKEMEYISNCSENFNNVMKLLETTGGKPLSKWLEEELKEIPEESFASVLRRRSKYISEAVRYLKHLNVELPERLSGFADGPLDLNEKADLLSRFSTKYLLLSNQKADRELFRRLSTSLRPLGFQLTTKGLRRCQSTVSRILALSEAKMRALVDILDTEQKTPDIDIRALVITDFEKSSAVIGKDIEELITEESGGAIAAMRTMTSNDCVDVLDPILVTGKTVLVDDDLLEKFMVAAEKWFSDRSLMVEMEPEMEQGFYRIKGSGRDWNTRNYVAMITALFEDGITRCLIGTRGLLGEGWDSLCANTLIDLTTAATSMTVNQLRGRAIRLNPGRPEKVANIWDVVCIAPEFEKGLSDYRRFARKHSNYYGICDDGAIEFGLGHIHPALTEAGPEDVALNAHVFNAEMLERAQQRLEIRNSWKIGKPYQNRENTSLELKVGKKFVENRTVFGTLNSMRGVELAADSKLKNICEATLETLKQLNLLKNREVALEVTERSDHYFRIFLDSSSTGDMELFTKCINELFQPLEDQRYIIPRYEQVLRDNWLSRILPAIFREYVVTKENRIAVYHPVPEAFSSSKRNAELFSNSWNIYVSPGRAVYAKRGKGEEMLTTAKMNKQSVENAKAKLKSVWR